MKKSIKNKRFLITGGAGFIGSNIVSFLLENDAELVRVLDDFSTGYESNIKEFYAIKEFELCKGSITNLKECLNACENVDYVIHQAALGSVPRSIDNPIDSNTVNVSGFVNVLTAAKEKGIKRIVYASSSSVYGDDSTMPKVENITGNLLSPYAVTKKTNELYADVFSRTYDMEIIGLRYFNVFGPKQNINGPYAAVIPIFINELLNNRSPYINGDGSTTRDFTFINNVIQANIKALFVPYEKNISQVYNIAYGGTISLNELYETITSNLEKDIKATYRDERKGDIKDSFANIDKAKKYLNFLPEITFEEGIKSTINWYKSNNEQ